MSLSNQPYKGTRDYYPEDKRLQNYIFETWRQVVESFGYEEYGAPTLESLDIYAAKSGQELVSEETYRFTDKGNREVAIRPEMTPSVARMMAARQQETPLPARWYSIANFMRYQRPQRGREREFWQLNFDLFGVEGLPADAEIITICDQIMKAFGAKPKMYTIKINHRGLIDVMMREYLGLDAVQSQLMMKLFDKKHKIAAEAFRQQVIEIMEPAQLEEGLHKIAGLIKAKRLEDLPKSILSHPLFEQPKKLFKALEKRGVKNAQFDISLMRGLDYYNGIVFEVFDEAPDNNRSMFGGGRYDGLTSVFGAENLPVIGAAPGASTFENFLNSHQLIPKLQARTEVAVASAGQEFLEASSDLADKLRAEGVRVELDIVGSKFDKQIKAALKKQIPFMLFVGEAEVKSERYSLRELATSKQDTHSFERIVSIVKDKRHRQLEF